MFANSPPGRSSTLPPIQRNGMTRPRKQSLSKRAREPQHKRQKSKESTHLHLKRLGFTRDAFSAEPSSAMSGHQKLDHRRWLDLIDAATSATEEEDEKTPVSAIKPPPSQMLTCAFRFLRRLCLCSVLQCLLLRCLLTKALSSRDIKILHYNRHLLPQQLTPMMHLIHSHRLKAMDLETNST